MTSPTPLLNTAAPTTDGLPFLHRRGWFIPRRAVAGRGFGYLVTGVARVAGPVAAGAPEISAQLLPSSFLITDVP